MIMSALVVAVCSCWKDKDDADSIFKIDLDKPQASIPVGGTAQLRAMVYPESVKSKTIRWLSDDESIAMVDANGLVRGIAPGLTIIRITDASGKIYPTTCAISVYTATVSVTGVSIAKSETTIFVNGYETLNHTVAPQNATNKNVTWSSNNSSVATVDINGKVTGIAAGSATITLTSEDGGLTSSCVVTVANEVIRVTGVSLNKTALTVSVNGTEQLAATIAPANATNKNVTLSSNATDVATVSAEGVITGIAAGSATITATSEEGGFASSCVVTVQEAAIPVTGVLLDKTAIDMYIGDVEQLSVTVVPDNATNKGVTWSSSSTNVVTVSDDGVVTGISAETATVTVTSDDGEFTETCIVTVKNEIGNVATTGWSAPDAKKYEYSMTYMAQVAFRGTLSIDVNTEVAAFVGDELRGYAKLVHEPTMDMYLIYLIIYSNSAGNETVSLKAYNPTKQRIYENCKEFVFHGDTSLGAFSEVLNCMP
jgi:uncharacterized protein YjdB